MKNAFKFTRGQKNLILGTFVLGLSFAFTSYAIKLPLFQKYLISILERSTRWEISYQVSHANLLSGFFQIEDIDLKDPQKKTHIHLEHLLINFNFLSAIRGKLIFSDVILDHPVIEITPRENKKSEKNFNFQQIQQALHKIKQSFFLQNLILENLSIQNLEIRQDTKEYLFEKAQLIVKPTLLRDLSAQIFVEDTSGNLPAISRLSTKFLIKDNGLDIEYFQLQTPKVILESSLQTLGNEKKGSINLRTKVQIPATIEKPINVSLQAELLNNEAKITHLEAYLDKGVVGGNGVFDLETNQYEIDFKAQNVILESIFSKLPSPVLGPAKGVAEIIGKAKGQFPQLSVKSEATINDLHHGPLYVKKAHGNLNLLWPELSWDAEVKGGDTLSSEAHVVGAVQFLKDPDTHKIQPGLKTLVADFEKARLEHLLPLWKALGEVNGQLLLKGAPKGSVQGTGYLTATQGQFLFQPIDNLETHLIFTPGGLVTFTDTHIQMPGISPIIWDGKLNIGDNKEATKEDLPIVFSGQLTEGVSVKGYYEKKTDTFKIENFHLEEGQNQLNFKLTAIGNDRKESSTDLLKPSKIDAQLQGMMDLAWLRFIPAYFHEGKGRARINLSCLGTSEDPLFRGEIEFLGSDLLLRGIPEEIHELSGKLKINGETLSSNLTGQLGNGLFKLNGDMGVHQGTVQTVNLTFNGNNLSFSKPNVYRVDLDIDGSLKGKLPSPTLSGKIDIIEGRYTKPFVIRDLVLKPFEEAAEPSALDQSVADINLNLTVRNSGDLRVRNNVATLFLQSNLQINGTFSKPKISGALSVTEGTFRFLGREFVLNEGLVEYSNPIRNQPYLTLSAQQDIPADQPRYTVYVDVRGFLDNLSVQLSSSPALEKQSIISLLAFGATQDEIRSGSASKKNLTTGVLGEEISTVLSEPLAKTTRLDIFRLEASESGNLSRLSVGKRLSDRFTLEFINDLDPVTAEKTFQGNYYLTDNILLKGFRKSLLGFDPSYELNLLLRFRLN